MTAFLRWLCCDQRRRTSAPAHARDRAFDGNHLAEPPAATEVAAVVALFVKSLPNHRRQRGARSMLVVASPAIDKQVRMASSALARQV